MEDEVETLEQRVIAWLTSEGLDVGGAPCARGPSLVAFVRKEIASALERAADMAHENMDHATRDELDAEVTKLQAK
jgi:hypothetical protein